ncbi:MAG: hypothetical protein WB537_03540 [Pseudolabrys sp.]|jgi:hypothetical protein
MPAFERYSSGETDCAELLPKSPIVAISTEPRPLIGRDADEVIE